MSKISTISFILLSILFYSCSAQTRKKDFIAEYQLANGIPVDTTSKTLQKIKQTSDWVLSLEKEDNFQLIGTGKNVVGYWDVEKINDKEYKLFLQGGGWAIYGRFDGKIIYFDKKYLMFDNLFSEVSFVKK